MSKSNRTVFGLARNHRYRTLDDFATLAAARSNPESLLESAVILDEVQRCPELLVALKRSVDEQRQPGRFILAGSANLARLGGLPPAVPEEPQFPPGEDPEHDAPRPAHEDADPEVLRSPALHRRPHFGHRRGLRVLRPERLYPQLQETDGHNSQAVSAGRLMWVGTVPASTGSGRQKKAPGQPFTSAVIVLPPTGTTACRASPAPPPLW